jgi:two-component system, chemotaxis family, chemotaxis protein CheY
MKLLIVEDLFLMRRVIKNTLNLMGITDITEAGDGLDALQLIKDNEYDIILTDWLMPKLDGLQLAKCLKNDDKKKKIPLVMITTVSEKENVVKAMRSGIDVFIAKPFTPDVLQNKVKELMGKHSLSLKN